MTLPRLSTLGALKEGDLYIERPADHDLLAALERGEYAYVLSSRQTGKTSLMARTLRKLRYKGCRCAKVDLGGLGTGADPAAWYLGLAVEIAEQIGCPDSFAIDCFARAERRTPIQRFTRFLRELLAESPEPLVVFLDEIENFLKLPMRVTDDFLTAVRSLYNDRDREPSYRRLSFCLMGVCTPNELIRDERRTPFNVCRGIDLEDFNWEAIRAGFLPLLSEMHVDAETALRRIYEWSSGHPYLTHRLVEETYARCLDGSVLAPDLVDALVRELFLNKLSGEQENFLEAERRLCLGPAHRIHRRLVLYRSVLQGQGVAARGSDLVHLELRLTGLIREVRLPDAEPYLAIRNRIFASVFDQAWSPKIDPSKIDPSLWMTEQIERWTELGRKDAFVLRGEELFEARRWADAQNTLEPACREFLEASRRVDDRERALRMNSLLFMTLWASSASFLLLPLLLDYWQQRAYPGLSFIGSLYAIPFLLALPAGILTDRYQMRSSQVIVVGLGLRLLGAGILATDLYFQKFAVAAAAVLLMVIGQILLRPQAAVLLGLLYPRNDRRADSAFITFYLFVNIGALLGPLLGAAMFKQYGWIGAMGTMIGELAVALYGFAVSYSAFSKLSFPSRDESIEPPVSRRRRLQATILLFGTLLVFWSAFYGLGSPLRDALTAMRPLSFLAKNLETGSLLAQGISSEAITPLFVLILTPVLIGLLYILRRLKREPSLAMKLGVGASVMAALLIVLSQTPSIAQTGLLGLYFVLTISELLVVPASMSATSALSSARSMFSMMSANYLTAGAGALLADALLHPAPDEFALLAAMAGSVGVIWLLFRRDWGTIERGQSPSVVFSASASAVPEEEAARP